MIRSISRILITSFLVFVSFLTLHASELNWIKLGTDFAQDISGMVALNDHEIMIVHDNKYPNETRLALVSIISRDSLSYSPILWPVNHLKPVDIETLSRNPENEDEFFLITSKGVGIFFTLTDNKSLVKIIKQFSVPLPLSHKPNAEGFAVWHQNGQWYATWGDRGSNDRPGVLFWGEFDFEKEDGEIVLLDSTTIKVPYPILDEVRHISELRIDSKGYLYITSASEASNDGPFDGAFYFAGKFTTKEGELHFNHAGEMIPLYKTPGYKIEALDIVPGPNGGLCFATDNENEGSFLYISWIN